MKAINPGHFLLTCRLDNWVHLLEENRFHIARDRLPQALYISATSLALAPAAAAESLIYRRRIRETKIEKDPIFILGHWRSGTTYLQNVLSRDDQFGWFDPVNTIGLPYSLLLGRLIRPPIEKGIQNGRPQDNVQYSLDLPMEETFGVLTISPYSIIHMIAFPENYKKYIEGAFVSDLPAEALSKWKRSYDYAVRKLTYIKKGKQLILKSPDNTARVRELWGMYPDARFINIHRDPYKTIRSTIHMFRTEMDMLRLTEAPDNLDELIEDTVIGIFERMYRELFALEGFFPKNRYVDVAYTDFCRSPVDTLRGIYRRLELSGFENAAPRFQAYVNSQRGYQKNKFDISSRLVRKINAKLGFYMEHYGYEMREVEEE